MSKITKSRFLAWVLVACMVIGMMPATALATDGDTPDENPTCVAQVNQTQYETLAGAIAAAQEGETITLLMDTDATAIEFNGGSSYTLDLNGKKLTVSSDKLGGIQITDGSKLTVTNGTYEFKSTSSTTAAIYVASSQLVLDGNITILQDGASGNNAVWAEGAGATVTINDGANIEVSGNRTYGLGTIFMDVGAKLSMNGGKVTLTAEFDGAYSQSNDVAGIVLGASASAEITGGEFVVNSKNGFAQGIQSAYRNGAPIGFTIRDASFTINETGSGEAFAFTFFYSTDGTGVVENATVTLNATNKDLVCVAYGGKPDLSIKGGTYSLDPTEYLADGYKATKVGNSYYVSVDAATGTEDSSNVTTEVIKDAVTEALKDTTGTETIVVEAPAATTTATVTDLIKAVDDAVTTAGTTKEVNLTIPVVTGTNETTTVTFNTAAVQAIADETTTGEIALKVVNVTEENVTDAATYEITLTKGGEEVFTTGTEDATATVSLPIPAALTGKTVEVYHIDGESKTAMGAEVKDGNVVFTTAHFSTYAIMEVNDTEGGGTTDPTVWDGTSTAIDWTGEGTEADPYVITTAAQLAGLAANVNAGTNYAGKYFQLGADVDLANNEWTPIGGFSGKTFQGTFDGAGYTVSNLSIRKPVLNMSGTRAGYLGLFGRTSGATLKNIMVQNAVMLKDADWSGTTDSVVEDIWYSAAVVGAANGCTIENCDVTGTVRIVGYGFMGGVVAYSYGGATVTNCDISGDVAIFSVAEGSAGAIIGSNAGTSSNNTAADTVFVSDGTDLVFDANWKLTGGTLSKEPPATLVAEGVTFGLRDDGKYGVIKEGETEVAAVDTDWYNTSDKEFTIQTEAQLRGLAAIVNGNATGIDADNFLGKTVKLGASIDLENRTWAPIGTVINPFCGTFDGGNYTISNLTITGTSSYAGLFGNIGTGGGDGTRGVVKNLTINNASVSGAKYVAAVAGCGNPATFENCNVTGTIKITSSNFYSGVIAGGWIATIKDCDVSGDITIDAFAGTGGIAGYGYWNISDCSVIGNDGSSIKGASYVGGIAGWTGENAHTIAGCTVKNITINGTDTAGGVVGMANYGITIVNSSVEDVAITTNTTDSDLTGGIIAGAVNGTETQPSLLVNNIVTSTTLDGVEVTEQAPSVSSGNEANTNYAVGSGVTLDSKGKVVSGEFTVMNETVASAILATGSLLTNNSDGTYTVFKAPASVTTSAGVTSYYATLAEAVKAAKDGDTVTLLADVDLGSSYVLINGKNITLDLAGHTVSSSYRGVYSVLCVYVGTLTVEDSIGGGKITNTGDGWQHHAICVWTGSLTVEGGEIYGYHTGIAVVGNDTADSVSVTVNAGTISSKGYAIAGNGSTGKGGSVITITGGTLIADGADAGPAIYHPQDGVLNITGGTITGLTGVQMCSGTLKISGSPIITATSEDTSGGKYGDGGIVDGAAISLISRPGYANTPTATIEGTPTVTSQQGQAVEAYTWNSSDKSKETWEEAAQTINISGGTYSSEVPEDLCAEGYIPTATTDAETGKTTYGVKEGSFVARVDGVGYETLQEAVDSGNGAPITVTLLDQVILTEQLNITKDNVTLVGDGSCEGTIIVGVGEWSSDNASKHLINITGKNVKLQNLCIAGLGDQGPAYGIQYYCASGEIAGLQATEFTGFALTINASDVKGTGTIDIWDCTYNAINVAYGENIPAGITESKFDFSEATLRLGTDLSGAVYADAGDLARAETAGATITIIAPETGWLVGTENGMYGAKKVDATYEKEDGTVVSGTIGNMIDKAPENAKVEVIPEKENGEVKSEQTITNVITAVAETTNEKSFSVQISAGEATVELDKAALGDINTAATGEGDVVLKVENVTSTAPVAGAKAVYEITLTQDGNELYTKPETGNNDGQLTITIPMPANLASPTVWYLPDGENPVAVQITDVKVEDGKISFVTNHLSTYYVDGVAYEEADNIQVGNQIGLIEPWFLRLNFRIEGDAEGEYLDPANFADYGVYFVKAATGETISEDILTPVMLENQTAIQYTKYTKNDVDKEYNALYKYENFYIGTDDEIGDKPYVFASFNKGIYTYQLNDRIYAVFYYQETEDSAVKYTVRDYSILELARKRIEASNGESEELAVYEAMVAMYDAIIPYRQKKLNP